MEMYFNPYPGAAKTEEEGINLAIGTADALIRLQKECSSISLSSIVSEMDGDLPPSKFVLFRGINIDFSITSILHKTTKVEHTKLLLLLQFFSKGKIIDNKDLFNLEDWVVSGIGASAPMLELAAKKKAVALTIPTEPEWRVDKIEFNDRQETLHNLWGQEDLSIIKNYCIESLQNIPERFAVQFDAEYCPGALNSAPKAALWEKLGYFQIMERAKKRNYQIDNNLIKNVADTKYGDLLELRIYSAGHRLFFVYRKDCSPEILIGGFYQKNESLSQNEAIQNAKKCIDDYSGD